MAMKTNSKANGCTFQWKIKNITHGLLRKNEPLISPAFTADAVEGTKWSLWWYTNGKTDEEDPSCYLHREKDCSGPDVIEVNYRFTVQDKDGLPLDETNESECVLSKGEFWRIPESEEGDTCDEKVLPEDTLTLQCIIRSKEEKIVKPNLFFAQTVFKVNRRSFIWKIDEFSTRNGVRNKFKDDLIEFDIVLDEVLDFVKKLDVHIISFIESIKFFEFKISIINSEGKKEECEENAYYEDDIKVGIVPTPLFSKMITENKSRYVLNDVLLLECEFSSSNGTVSDEISSYGTISPTVTDVVAEKEKDQHTPVLANDLKSVYSDGIFSDAELRTSNQTFPVHKIILVARSPVFRRMFSNDMKERNSGHVDVTDLEEDTVQRMLLYMYTDSLEDLQFESACKLYSAGDKYDIMSLRSRCASFLKDNLCPNKACDVLVFADRHHDEDLKSAAQDFILGHDKEVFGSQEWKQFMATNTQLAADVMYRKFLPG